MFDNMFSGNHLFINALGLIFHFSSCFIFEKRKGITCTINNKKFTLEVIKEKNQ